MRRHSSPTRILIARHGQTVTNREGRFCGHAETELTPLGIEQARALRDRLAETPIDAAYASDFSRAIRTAAIVLEGHAIPIQCDPALRELHYGEWELSKETAIRKAYREQYELMRAEDPAWRPPGGETLGEVRARTYAALRRVMNRHRRQTTLVITHGTAINCMLAEAFGMSPAHTLRFQVANCGLTEVIELGGRPYLVTMNDCSHLAGMGVKP